jgi:hypothetical protein
MPHRQPGAERIFLLADTLSTLALATTTGRLRERLRLIVRAGKVVERSFRGRYSEGDPVP